MRRIRSKNTAPEILVRSWLHRHGFRFRLHVKTLPGHPDIVLRKYKTIIEIRGCFWHQHKNCRYATVPQSNVEFWNEKLQKNIQRDKRHEKEWCELGWSLIVLWTCELKTNDMRWTNKLSCMICNTLQLERDNLLDGIDFEGKAFYDILKGLAVKYDFTYPEDKLIVLAKEVKLVVDDKARFTDCSARDNIKAELRSALILLFAKHKYPSVDSDEVYKKIFEQAENCKKYQANLK